MNPSVPKEPARRRARRARSTPRGSAGARLAWLVPLVVAVVVYVPTLRHGFVWDDTTFIERNPAAHGWSELLESLRHGYGWVPSRGAEVSHTPALDVAGTEEDSDAALYYRPVVTFLNGAQWLVFGGSAAAFHALNMIAHGLVSALIAALLLALGAPALAAGVAGLLFAVHPMTSEAVAWISGRTDVLSTAFALAAVYGWVRSRRPADAASGDSARQSRRWEWWAAGALLLALGCKETAFFVGAGLVLLSGGRRVTMWLLASLVLGFAARTWILGGTPLDTDLGTTPLEGPPVWRSGALFLVYVSRILVPWRPKMEAPTWVDSPPALLGITGLGLLVGLVVTGLWMWRRAQRSPHPGPVGRALGLGLTLAGILPVLHWVPIGELYGERFLYLPLAGLALLAGSAAIPPADEGPDRRARPRTAWFRWAMVLAIPWVAVLWVRLPDWESDLTLFASARRDVPERARSHANYGSALFLAGRGGEAVEPLEQAIAMDPGNLGTRAQLGALLVNLGRPEEGLPHLEAAAAEGARDRGLLYNLGIARLRAGELVGAREALEAVVQEHPRDVAALEGLANVARKANDPARAARLLQQVIEIDPTRKSAYLNLIGVLYYESGDPGRARGILESFLAAFPASAEAAPTLQLLQALGPQSDPPIIP